MAERYEHINAEIKNYREAAGESQVSSLISFVMSVSFGVGTALSSIEHGRMRGGEGFGLAFGAISLATSVYCAIDGRRCDQQADRLVQMREEHMLNNPTDSTDPPPAASVG